MKSSRSGRVKGGYSCAGGKRTYRATLKLDDRALLNMMYG